LKSPCEELVISANDDESLIVVVGPSTELDDKVELLLNPLSTEVVLIGVELVEKVIVEERTKGKIL
jgi:hypothetical protein